MAQSDSKTTARKDSLPVPVSPGIHLFLHRLACVDGHVSIHKGVLTFPDGCQVDLLAPPAMARAGLSSCWHCAGVMTPSQRYLCGCPKCIEQSGAKP